MNENYLLNIIANIGEKKADIGVAPRAALREEIMAQIYEDMRQSLGALLKSQKIIYHRTLNSWSVEIRN